MISSNSKIKLEWKMDNLKPWLKDWPRHKLMSINWWLRIKWKPIEFRIWKGKWIPFWPRVLKVFKFSILEMIWLTKCKNTGRIREDYWKCSKTQQNISTFQNLPWWMMAYNFWDSPTNSKNPLWMLIRRPKRPSFISAAAIKTLLLSRLFGFLKRCTVLEKSSSPKEKDSSPKASSNCCSTNWTDFGGKGKRR